MGDVRLAGLAQLAHVRRRAYRPGAPQQRPLLGGQVVRGALQVEDVVGDRVVGGGRVLEVGRLGGGHGTSLRLQAGNREWGMRGMAGSRRRDGHAGARSEEHTSELQSLMRISYAVFCLKKTHKM